ncbi:MAG: 4-alpha-glucanotransferase, partial [Fusobacteriaceae bacterium]
MFQKSSGILMHISSLPSKYGIGDFGEEAYKFVDFLVEAKQKVWQILPIGPTGYGDSPYQSFSTFAGNPYFINLDELVDDGLLTKEDLVELKKNNEDGIINFGKIYNLKMPILKKAYDNFLMKKDFTKKYLGEDFDNFRIGQKYWLEDYACYMSLKEIFGGKSWTQWSTGYKNRDKKIMSEFFDSKKTEINYYVFLQYLFFSQWKKLKDYANKNGIKIIGDVPIYIAGDSSDSWANTEMFLFDKVAGCPPDYFSADGQLWGNPIYDWQYMEKTNFEWWVERIKACLKMHDIVRIDHFRGLESYWSIPFDAKTAATGTWEKGPGMKLIKAINKNLKDAPIIAEDLGFLTDDVRKLLADSGYPGMKILLFAFESKEESDYLPHKYPENSVAYTGTHDNETVVGWYQNATLSDKNNCDKYLASMKEIESNEINWKF